MDRIGPLQNVKWERFAREFAAGESLEAAYVRAGYEKAGKFARFNASKLRNKPAVKARIAELMEQFAEQAAVHADYVRQKLLPVLQANVQDMFDASGKIKPAHLLQREFANAVKSIKLDKHGRIAEVHMVDKIAAAATILKSIGAIDDGSDTAVQVNVLAGLGIEDQAALEAELQRAIEADRSRLPSSSPALDAEHERAQQGAPTVAAEQLDMLDEVP
jgi:Terminase small subunit